MPTYLPRVASVLGIVAALAATAAAIFYLATSEPAPEKVPAGAAALVNGEPISQTAARHWVGVVARQSGAPGAAVPDAPKFTRCVADGRRQKLPKNTPRPSTANLRAQCKASYDQMLGQAMGFLITARWFEDAAKELDLKVGPAQVTAELARQRKQQFKTDKAYRKFLAQTGMTPADLRLRTQSDLYARALQQHAVKAIKNPSNAEIASYYAKNKRKYGRPERRTIQVVLARNEAKAKQALSLVRAGASLTAVAQRFSIDKASAKRGGVLKNITAAGVEPDLSKRVFSSPKGRLVGPVKSQFGYYIFRVRSVSKASQQTLRQASAAVRSQLRADAEQKAVADLGRDFEKRFKAKTRCAKGFVVAPCANAPKQPKQPQQGQQPPAQGQQQAPAQPQPSQQQPPTQ